MNNTFRAIAEEYALEKMKYRSEDYVKQFKSYMEKDVYKIIGDKPIKDVNSADILIIMKNTVSRVRKLSHYGTGEVPLPLIVDLLAWLCATQL